MKKIFEFVRTKLNKAINEKQVFIYEGQYVNAVAFFKGMNDNKNVCEVKQMAREVGLKYDYTYECYIQKEKNKKEYKEYRKEKDEFIDKLLNWKTYNN